MKMDRCDGQCKRKMIIPFWEICCEVWSSLKRHWDYVLIGFSLGILLQELFR